VAGAGVGEAGAGGSLAGDAVVALEAVAEAGATVAGALVGALHVIMGGVVELTEIGIFHLGKLLGGAVGVGETVVNHWVVGAGKSSGHVEISLWSINMG